MAPIVEALDERGPEEVDEDVSPGDLALGKQPLSLAAHPRRSGIFAVGLVDGSVELRDGLGSGERPALARLLHGGEGSARCVCWCGDALVAGFESGSVAAWDCSDDASSRGKLSWSARRGAAVTAVLPEAFDDEDGGGGGGGGPVLALGDDDGYVALYDARLRGAAQRGAAAESQPHEDYVSDLACHGGTHLFSAGTDGRLGVCDPRKGLAAIKVSDPQDDELLSVCVVKGGKKVVCGTQTGPLVFWSWGRWGDSTDRVVGHPESVDVLLKVDEDVLCTGSSDGLLRVARVQPGLQLLGVLGDHGGFPIEHLDFNADRSLVLSISHDDVVRFFDARPLADLEAGDGAGDDSDADSDDGDDDSGDDAKDDSDDDGDDSSDDSSDDDRAKKRRKGGGASTTLAGGSRLSLKTKAESFFDGL